MSRTLQEALPQRQHATPTLASPGSISIAETSQNARSSEMTPYHAPSTEDFGSFDTTSYDTSGMGGPGDDHGQRLFDFDLAWTFDFLNKDGGSDVELPAPQCDTVTATQEVDGTIDWSNPNAHDGVQQPSLPGVHTPTNIPDEDEVNDMLRTWPDASLMASAISEGLRSALSDIVTSDDATDHSVQGFPSCRSLQYFLLLYIRRVHPRFPAMHIPTFSTAKTPAIVLMAMMLAGSCHSVSDGDRFCRGYLDRCRYWLTATREKDLKSVSTRVLPRE